MARRLPSLNALKAFEAAARHGSFTEAAEELHVSHAAISRHVRDLEAWLKVPLFRRLSRGVVVTEPGRGYQESLTRIFDDLLAATQAVQAPSATGELQVSAETAFAARWLVPRLGHFQDRYPEIELILDSSEQVINFRNDPAELAIRYGAGNWPDVDSITLIELEVFPVCRPSLVEGRMPKSPKDLKAFTLIHEETKDWWKDWLVEAGVSDTTLGRGTVFKYMHSALDAAEAGQGIALADNLLAADAIAAGRLVRLLDIAFPEGGYFIVRPKGLKESPAAAAFRDWLQEEMADFKAGCGSDHPSEGGWPERRQGV
ncbi:MAG: transcriptional regulator GcvA [Pseudomonadota bacterium]